MLREISAIPELGYLERHSHVRLALTKHPHATERRRKCLPWWKNRVGRGTTAGHICFRKEGRAAYLASDLPFDGGAGRTRTFDRRIMR